MTASARLYNYGFSEARTYLFSLIFVAGNILLPQLLHLVPNGGTMFLPIYFFTLIAAYKYGRAAGLATAVFSPLVNSLFFAMPPLAFLPVILIKSVILALSASWIASKSGKINLINLLLVVLMYQLSGGVFEALYLSNIQPALQDFAIGFPGMLLQIFGGYLLLKALSKS